MEILWILALLFIIAAVAAAVLGMAGELSDRQGDFARDEIVGEIRSTGWQARRAMDRVSDEYLRSLHQQRRRR